MSFPLLPSFELCAYVSWLGVTGRLFCPRCQLQVAYETKAGEGQKGDVTFILAGSFSSPFSPSYLLPLLLPFVLGPC